MAERVELGSKAEHLLDLALRAAIVRHLRAAERKMTFEHPPDERGMQHPWPVEFAALSDSIQRFGRAPLPAK